MKSHTCSLNQEGSRKDFLCIWQIHAQTSENAVNEPKQKKSSSWWHLTCGNIKHLRQLQQGSYSGCSKGKGQVCLWVPTQRTLEEPCKMSFKLGNFHFIWNLLRPFDQTFCCPYAELFLYLGFPKVSFLYMSGDFSYHGGKCLSVMSVLNLSSHPVSL